jgi:excisionase family DNA binding protein
METTATVKPILDASPTSLRFLLRPEEGAHAVGISRAQFYKYMAEGRIKSIKLGRSRRIPVAELERWLSEELAKQTA